MQNKTKLVLHILRMRWYAMPSITVLNTWSWNMEKQIYTW